VKEVVRRAIAEGVLVYDVREMKPDPVFDASNEKMTLDGKYNPYAQEARATGSLAFSHTEITPEKILRDMETEQTFNILSGYEEVNGQRTAMFREVTRKGSGIISQLYDEARWPDTMARGPQGQKHADNVVILADGSIHCAPASRRYAAEPWLIITNGSLARGQLMLFNGHLRMENGVVTYVGMSGRLCRLMRNRNGVRFIDPIELLKAHGFELRPGLRLTAEG
jgi:hypothetical protein